MTEERLQKVLAHAGVASRRKAEELMQQGRVEVNGKIVTELGTTVDPDRDSIRVDGRPISMDAVEWRYFALNKPADVISTVRDPYGRTTVVDLVSDQVNERLVPVGRLDADSDGLLLLTNDGALVNRLTHPRYEHEKEYRVIITGHPDEGTLQALRDGIELADGTTLPAEVWIADTEDDETTVGMILREGRNRQIRRMMDAVGHTVVRLTRVRMGPIELGNMAEGEVRELSKQEIRWLKEGFTRPPE